MATTCP